MQLVAQGWLVYDLTHSPFYLGVVGMARAIPMLVFPAMGGVIADRLPRLRWLKATQTASFVLALVLAVLIAADLVEIWQIVLFSFLSGLVNAFDQPTRQALLPDLVRREDLTKAIALNSSSWQGSSLFGPTLAGVAIATIGVSGAFFANAFGILAVVAALFLMEGVPEYSSTRGVRQSLTGDLFAGLMYVRATPLIFMLLAMSAVTNVFGRSYQQLLPVFAREVFDEGGLGLGIMFSAPGAGTLCGALALTLLTDQRRKGALSLGGMLLFAGSLVVFALNRNFAPGVGLLFLTGLFNLMFSSMMTTILQLESPPEMRGRVMSLVTVTMQGFAPIGAVMTGAIATQIGTPEAVALSAMVCGAVAVLAYALAPVMRNYEFAGAPTIAPLEAARGASGVTEPAFEPR